MRAVGAVQRRIYGVETEYGIIFTPEGRTTLRLGYLYLQELLFQFHLSLSKSQYYPQLDLLLVALYSYHYTNLH